MIGFDNGTEESLIELLETYHKSELNLLTIPVVVGQSEQLKCPQCNQLEPCANNSPETCWHPKVC